MSRFTSNKVIIFLVYIVLTALAILSYLSTSLTIENLLPGLLFMWICYIFYWFGERTSVFTKQAAHGQLAKIDSIILNDWKIVILLAINAAVFSIAITTFYTGQTPVSAFKELFGNNQLYLQYQRYYQQNDLGKMSVIKYPYIAMNFLLNFITIYLYVGVLLVYSGKKRWYHILSLVVCGGMYLYYGVARGTNFELFLFVFLNMFIIVRRVLKKRGLNTAAKTRTRLSYGLVILAFLAISTVIFIAVTNRRMTVGSRYYLSKEVYSDSGKALSAIWPTAGVFIARIAQYFTWGIYYTSVFFTKIVFTGAQSFLNGLFPSGLSNEFSISRQIATFIDPGVNWMPDVVVIWDSFGLLGLVLLIYSVAYLSKKLYSRYSVISQIALYLVCLQMFSLPIGNFITVLSANKLLVVTALAMLLIDAFLSKYKLELVRDLDQ